MPDSGIHCRRLRLSSGLRTSSSASAVSMPHRPARTAAGIARFCGNTDNSAALPASPGHDSSAASSPASIDRASAAFRSFVPGRSNENTPFRFEERADDADAFGDRSAASSDLFQDPRADQFEQERPASEALGQLLQRSRVRRLERHSASEDGRRFARGHLTDHDLRPVGLAGLFGKRANPSRDQQSGTVETQELREIVRTPYIVHDDQTSASLQGFREREADLLLAGDRRRSIGRQRMKIAQDRHEVRRLTERGPEHTVRKCLDERRVMARLDGERGLAEAARTLDQRVGAGRATCPADERLDDRFGEVRSRNESGREARDVVEAAAQAAPHDCREHQGGQLLRRPEEARRLFGAYLVAESPQLLSAIAIAGDVVLEAIRPRAERVLVREEHELAQPGALCLPVRAR